MPECFHMLFVSVFLSVLLATAYALPSHQPPRSQLVRRYTAPEGQLALTMTEFTRLTDNSNTTVWGEPGKALVLGSTISDFEGSWTIDVFEAKTTWKTDPPAHSLQCTVRGLPDNSTITIDISNRIPYFKPQNGLPFNTGSECSILA